MTRTQGNGPTALARDEAGNNDLGGSMSENKNTAAEPAEFVRLDRYSYEIVVGGEVVGIVWRCGNESKWFAREPDADKSPDFLYPAPAHSRLEAVEIYLAWRSEQADLAETSPNWLREYANCWRFEENPDMVPDATVFQSEDKHFGFLFSVGVYLDKVYTGMDCTCTWDFDKPDELYDLGTAAQDLVPWFDAMGDVLQLVKKWHAAGHYGPRLALLGEAHHA